MVFPKKKQQLFICDNKKYNLIKIMYWNTEKEPNNVVTQELPIKIQTIDIKLHLKI